MPRVRESSAEFPPHGPKGCGDLAGLFFEPDGQPGEWYRTAPTAAFAGLLRGSEYPLFHQRVPVAELSDSVVAACLMQDASDRPVILPGTAVPSYRGRYQAANPEPFG